MKLKNVLKLCSVFAFITLGSCSANSDKVIKVCASSVPHKEVLDNCVKAELKTKGYTLEVSDIDWDIPNECVSKGDFDANYFQHVPYLETYTGTPELFAVCKVHYEPLGIYYGKAGNDTALTDGVTFEICNDPSNAIRAFNLLAAKGVLSKETEGTNWPVNEDDTKLTLSSTSTKWTSTTGKVVSLISENLLTQSMNDYDFACLPCNTALTGNVSSTKRVAVEDDPTQVSLKANIIAARKDDYKNNATYKAKIDALADVMLSQKVSDYFKAKYNGVITCDSSTQIDLRTDTTTK